MSTLAVSYLGVEFEVEVEPISAADNWPGAGFEWIILSIKHKGDEFSGMISRGARYHIERAVDKQMREAAKEL